MGRRLSPSGRFQELFDYMLPYYFDKRACYPLM